MSATARCVMGAKDGQTPLSLLANFGAIYLKCLFYYYYCCCLSLFFYLFRWAILSLQPLPLALTTLQLHWKKIYKSLKKLTHYKESLLKLTCASACAWQMPYVQHTRKKSPSPFFFGARDYPNPGNIKSHCPKYRAHVDHTNDRAMCIPGPGT